MGVDKCGICGCSIHHGGEYAKPTIKGRSHATRHHLVAERFFGRSATRKDEQREPIFKNCPWGREKQRREFCYECHEELLHNPVFLPEDISRFAELVRLRDLDESEKPASKDKIARRIELLHEVIEEGVKALLAAERTKPSHRSNLR